MRRALAGTVAVLLAAGLTACVDPEPTAGPAPAPAGAVSSAAPSSAASAAAARPGTASTGSAPRSADSPVTLAFGGDVHFEGRLAGLLAPDGLAALQPLLGSADVAVVNLETAITDRGVEQPKIY